MSAEGASAPPEPPRWCKVCGRAVEGSVCPRCALDLDTGELVGVPEPLDRRDRPAGGDEALYEARPPRPTADWGLQLYRQLARSFLGTLVAWMLLCAFYGLRGLSTIPALVALGCVLVLRCAQTYASPLLLPVRVPGEPTPEERGAREPRAPREPDERERTPLAFVIALALFEAALFAVFVGGPAAGLLDKNAFLALQSAGLLPPLATTWPLARASLVGTVFLGGLVFALWVRVSAREAPAHRPGPPTLPTSPLLIGGAAFIRGLGVAFLLALLVRFPWLLIVGVFVFSLVIAGIADPGGDGWHPRELWDAARARAPRTYLRNLALSAPLLALIVGSLALPYDGGYGSLLLASAATVAASLLGAAAGLDHYDTATRWRRIPRASLPIDEGAPPPSAWPAPDPEAPLELDAQALAEGDA